MGPREGLQQERLWSGMESAIGRRTHLPYLHLMTHLAIDSKVRGHLNLEQQSPLMFG